MITEGKHKARGTEAALGLTAGGKEEVAVALVILDGEHAGDSITWHGYFTEKTQQRTIESLRYLGWEGDNLAVLDGIDRNEVTIVVEHEEGQDGKTYAKVRWINGPGGGLALKERMDPGAAAAFAQRMRGFVVAQGQKTKPATAGAKPPTNGKHTQRNAPDRDPLEGADMGDDEPPF